jgi:hypothetical protein
MRAFQVAELDQLMADEAGIAVGDGQVSLAFFHWNTGRASGASAPSGVDQPGRAGCSIVEHGFAVGHARHGAADHERRAQSLRLPGQMQRDGWRIDDGVFDYQQSAGQAWAQVRLQGGQFAAGEQRLGTPRAAARACLRAASASSSSSAATQMVPGVRTRRWRQAGAERLPQLLRAAGERELRLRVVHDHDVAHAGGGRAAAEETSRSTNATRSRPARRPARRPRQQCRRRRSRTSNRLRRSTLIPELPAGMGRRDRRSSGFGGDIGRAGDGGNDSFCASGTSGVNRRPRTEAALEDGAENAFLPPDLAGLQACHRRPGRPSWRWFRCRMGSGRRLCRGRERSCGCVGRVVRFGEELDVVDLRAIGAGDAGGRQARRISR